MKRSAVAIWCILLALPAWGQSVLSLEGMSEQQRAEYVRLMRGYVETFRILGRARLCGLNFDPEPYWREVKRRHGETSEAVAVAALGFAAGAENEPLSRELAPPSAPMPCDVVQYLREMRLPELPASLNSPGFKFPGQGGGLRGAL